MSDPNSVEAVVEELRALGSPSIKKVLVNHGATEPFFAVKVGDMKPIVKRLGVDYQLSLDLYNTGISDAMYLAGLIADDAKMTRTDLEKWVADARWSLLFESTVPWVAAGSPVGLELAQEWIEIDDERISSAGWRTLSSIASVTADDKLDLQLYTSLLHRVAQTIHTAPNRTRSCMSGFISAVGVFIAPLSQLAIDTAKAVGVVIVNNGNTACKAPSAENDIAAAAAKGVIGKKRKTAKC